MLLSPKGSGLDQREKEREREIWGNRSPEGSGSSSGGSEMSALKKGALELGLGRMNRSLQTEKVGHAN